MARRAVKRDITVEEFDAWVASGKKFDAVAEAADERGGPVMSLVPLTGQDGAWPTDLPAPAKSYKVDEVEGPPDSLFRSFTPALKTGRCSAWGTSRRSC